MTDTVVVTTPDTSPAVLQPTLTDAIAAALSYAAAASQSASSALSSANTAGGAAAAAATSAGSAAASAAIAYARRTVSDANYSVQSTDIYIEFDSLTAARTVTLPLAANAYPGRPLILVDASGNCSASNYISLVLQGSDTFVGLGAISLRLTRTGRPVILFPTALNSWVVLSAPPISQVFTGTTGTILGGTEYAGITALSSSGCALTLPSAASYPRGGQLTVGDETGSCSSTNVITVSRAGSDTISGLTSEQLQSPYQRVTFMSNGVNLWTIA